MIAAMDILITKAETSKLHDLDPDNLPFGRYFSDHMLEADYENGEWEIIKSIISCFALWTGNF
jgi:branched-chain amino acid aminotransferase